MGRKEPRYWNVPGVPLSRRLAFATHSVTPSLGEAQKRRRAEARNPSLEFREGFAEGSLDSGCQQVGSANKCVDSKLREFGTRFVKLTVSTWKVPGGIRRVSPYQDPGIARRKAIRMPLEHAPPSRTGRRLRPFFFLLPLQWGLQPCEASLSVVETCPF